MRRNLINVQIIFKETKVIENDRSIYRSDSVSLHAPKFFGNEIEYTDHHLICFILEKVEDFENKMLNLKLKKAVAL